MIYIFGSIFVLIGWWVARKTDDGPLGAVDDAHDFPLSV